MELAEPSSLCYFLTRPIFYAGPALVTPLTDSADLLPWFFSLEWLDTVTTINSDRQRSLDTVYGNDQTPIVVNG